MLLQSTLLYSTLYNFSVFLFFFFAVLKAIKITKSFTKLKKTLDGGPKIKAVELQLNSDMAFHTIFLYFVLFPAFLYLLLSGRQSSCVWIIFVHKRRGLQFKVDFNRQIFEKILFHSQSFCPKTTVRKSPKMSNLGFEQWPHF